MTSSQPCNDLWGVLQPRRVPPGHATLLCIIPPANSFPLPLSYPLLEQCPWAALLISGHWPSGGALTLPIWSVLSCTLLAMMRCTPHAPGASSEGRSEAPESQPAQQTPFVSTDVSMTPLSLRRRANRWRPANKERERGRRTRDRGTVEKSEDLLSRPFRDLVCFFLSPTIPRRTIAKVRRPSEHGFGSSSKTTPFEPILVGEPGRSGMVGQDGGGASLQDKKMHTPL